MPILKDDHHRNLAFWGLMLIAVGLPLSVFLMSVGTFILAGNWILEGRYLERLKRFSTDPLSLALISVYALHLLGMLFTDDLSEGLKQLRVKLPLLLMPLLLFTSKLPDKKQQRTILFMFIVANVVGSIIGMNALLNANPDEILNKRHLSVFISHIRFGLMLTFSFFMLAYYLYVSRNEWSLFEKALSLVVLSWIFFFIIILEAFTAYMAFAVLLAFTLFWIMIRLKNRRLKLTTLSVVILFAIFSTGYIYKIVDNHFERVPVNPKTHAVKTLNGNYYSHQSDVPYRENGHLVWNFVCWEELEKEWPNKSAIDFQADDQLGQPIRFTAIRYMTSKGLRKDSVGIHQLSEHDIQQIEQGFTNYKHTGRLGISRRIDQMFWAFETYQWNKNANGSSTIQRWVYMEIGWSILKANPFFGVGTGDVLSSYRDAYEVDSRGLEKAYQGISHNQFLTIAIAFGFFGFTWFVLSIIYPVIRYRNDYLYMAFVLLMVVSFLTDNTLDRQSGVTLVAFFNAFLIVRREFAETAD